MAKARRPKQRRKRDDPVLDRVIGDVLNGNVDVIPEFADLPRRWREAPEDASDRENPWDPAKDELVARYILLAFTQPQAREGLRRLTLELIKTGEPIPEFLLCWNRWLLILGDPPLRPGAPHKIDRDARVGIAFKLLGKCEYTREEAIAHIAEWKRVSDETIRTAINNNRIHLRSQ